MLNYLPDADPWTPDVIQDTALNIVPTLRGGMRNGYVTTDAGVSVASAAASAVTGCHLVQTSTGYRMLVGTTNKTLLEYALTSWTDRSRAAGYSGASGLQWLFEQYGDTVIAIESSAATIVPQVSSSAGFADLAGAPKARIVVVAGNALFVFNLIRSGVTYVDGWHRSDTGNFENWTPEDDGGVGESAFGQFTETPGPITAAIKRGNEVVVFKRRGMWRGHYVGLPEIMEWEFISGTIGCLGPKAVINVDDQLFFADPNDIYRYDGSRPQPITRNPLDGGPGIKNKWVVLARAGTAAGDRTFWGHDDESGLLYLFYTASSNLSFYYLAYNYRTGAWGTGVEDPIRSSSTAGGIHTGSFLNASSDLVRNCALFSTAVNPPSSAKPAAVCFGLNSAGTTGQPKWFRDGVGISSGAVPSWQMSRIGSSAKRGGQVSRIYPTFVSGSELASTDTMAARVVGFRNRGVNTSLKQGDKTGTLVNGQIDVLAQGTFFLILYTVTPAALTSAGFEMLGQELEFAETSAPRNAVGA